MENQSDIVNKTIEEKKAEFIKSLNEKKERLSKEHENNVSYQVCFGKEYGGEHEKTVIGWFKQPHIFLAAAAMDMVISREFFSAGLKLWNDCLLPKESSPEVSEQKYQLGMLANLGLSLETINPDVKKS